jgi:hypothetical protein
MADTMYTTYSTGQRGKYPQQLAMRAFNDGRLEDAYDLYVHAESEYREALANGESWTSTRLFFVQSSILRCLEQMIEETPGLFSTYRSRAEKFFDEWSTDKIRAMVKDRHRQSEALAFRAWRESYFTGANDFRAAAAASQKGDFANAKAILEAFIERTQGEEGQERDALCALARSKIEKLRTQREMQKRPQERNLRIVAAGYLRAAKVLRLPANTESSQRQQFSAFRDWFRSDALKFRAFELFRRKRTPEPVLISAQRLMARALRYAQRAVSRRETPPNHAIYLNYWHKVISERVHLMAFMSRGEDADYQRAVNSWKEALTAARKLCPRGDAESPFRHHFYSLKDLNSESDFLAAAKAFREKQWSECALLLERRREGLRPEFEWTWRDVNIYIRQVGVKAIEALVSLHHEQFTSQCKTLRALTEDEPAGGAARYFADTIMGLKEKAKDLTLLNMTLASLAEYFPLDSWVDSSQEPRNIDTFASLPEKIHRILVRSSPASEADVDGMRRMALGAIEALLAAR